MVGSESEGKGKQNRIEKERKSEGKNRGKQEVRRRSRVAGERRHNSR